MYCLTLKRSQCIFLAHARWVSSTMSKRSRMNSGPEHAPRSSVPRKAEGASIYSRVITGGWPEWPCDYPRLFIARVVSPFASAVKNMQKRRVTHVWNGDFSGLISSSRVARHATQSPIFRRCQAGRIPEMVFREWPVPSLEVLIILYIQAVLGHSAHPRCGVWCYGPPWARGVPLFHVECNFFTKSCNMTMIKWSITQIDDD